MSPGHLGLSGLTLARAAGGPPAMHPAQLLGQGAVLVPVDYASDDGASLVGTDGGSHWSPTADVHTSVVAGSFVNLHVGYVASGSGTALGQVLNTADGGATRDPVSTGILHVTALQFLDPPDGWILQSGHPLETTDGRESWTQVRAGLASG